MAKHVDTVLFLAKYINQLEANVEKCSVQPLVKKVVKKFVIDEVKDDQKKDDKKDERKDEKVGEKKDVKKVEMKIDKKDDELEGKKDDIQKDAIIKQDEKKDDKLDGKKDDKIDDKKDDKKDGKIDDKKGVKKSDETVEEEEDNVPVLNKELAALKPFQETEEIYPPQMCIWDFMGKEDLESLLAITNRGKLREKLEERIGKTPTGFSKLIVIEFLLDATNFCRRSTFNIEQCGSIISMLYWSHKFFTTNLFVCPEDVFNYFREFLIFHSLFFPPTHINLFTPQEGEIVLKFFWRLYIRHLPLIRMLTLPNFGFELEYVLEPEMKQDKGGKKGKGKDKGGKKDKKGGKKK